MLRIHFTKYSGCGNDFILIDNRNGEFPDQNETLIHNLCLRSLGIGADGLILLENGLKSPYRMRVFNSDGKEAKMCGNGLRCFGMFLKELQIPEDRFDVEVSNKLYPISVEGSQVTVAMIPPAKIEWKIKMCLENQELELDFLDTGVPHAVQFVKDIEKIDIEKIGPFLRHHKMFAPAGTNVDFASLRSDNTIEMRTYERGVEAETLACGTGSAAVAIAAAKKYNLKNPIVIQSRSGDCIEFNLSLIDDKVCRITMKGPAKQIYSGIVEV